MFFYYVKLSFKISNYWDLILADIVAVHRPSCLLDDHLQVLDAIVPFSGILDVLKSIVEYHEPVFLIFR